MKRWIHSGTEVKTYRNKKNPNKFVEVHEDGYGHRSAKQYMHWDETDVTNPTGDGNLHRWRKDNMNELLDDYEEIQSSEYYEDADTYVIKIWYEVDPGRDAMGPQAAEEIFTTVAGSPSEAMEQVKREWSGPIDRIEIVDINPEDGEYEELPFE